MTKIRENARIGAESKERYAKMKRKVRIEADPTLAEEEIVIRCRTVDGTVLRMRRMAEECADSGADAAKPKALTLTLAGCEYFVPVDSLLYFETGESRTAAHTADRIYYTDLHLAQLAEILPDRFIRASKSCILNAGAVNALRRDVTGIGEAFFPGCEKRVYISRMYYKAVRERVMIAHGSAEGPSGKTSDRSDNL